MDVDAIEVRVTRLEQDVIDIRNKELESLRTDLRKDYLNKYQLMNEFITRKENENLVLKRNAELENAGKIRREWPLIIGGCVVGISSVVSVILQAIGH
jgi:hypothetical protein